MLPKPIRRASALEDAEDSGRMPFRLSVCMVHNLNKSTDQTGDPNFLFPTVHTAELCLVLNITLRTRTTRLGQA